MKKFFLILVATFGFYNVFAQSLISEKQIPLEKEQQKHEMEFALSNPSINGVTVFFEPEKAEKVKGEKRKYERYEMALDKDFNIVSAEYKTLGTKNSVKPKIYFSNFRIGYTIWTDDEYLDSVYDKNGEFKKMTEVPKIVFQLIKYDNKNIITAVEDYVLCDEKGFDSYRVLPYNGDLIVMAQYEKKKTAKGKDEKNRDYIVYKLIDPAAMQIKKEKELNLLGKDDLGLETFVVSNNKIFLVGKQIFETKVLGIKVPKGFYIFKLNMDGVEEARGEITVPLSEAAIGSVYLYEKDNTLYMCGEYGNPAAIQKPVPYPQNNKTIKVTNPFDGMFIKKFDFNLKELATATFDYKEKILKKLKKGNPKFNPRKGAYNIQDFYVLNDGSFYITSEMFVKFWETKVVKNQTTGITTYYYYTHFDYMDALVFKFNSNGELDWVNQIDRDNYRKTYRGHLKSMKPLEPGKLETFLMPGDKLAMFYNTPGRKYGKKRFGLSEVVVSPDGSMTDAFDFTSNAEFGLLDGGLVKIDENTVLAVGTDKKEKTLWIKKIKILD